jgi:subtilisin family serine protease
MAAPHVTGALVLLAAARPDLDAAGLRDALLAGTRRGLLDVETGALDAGAALHAVVDASTWRPAPAPAAATAKAAAQRAKKAATKKKVQAKRAKKASAKKRVKAKRSKRTARR